MWSELLTGIRSERVAEVTPPVVVSNAAVVGKPSRFSLIRPVGARLPATGLPTVSVTRTEIVEPEAGV